MEAVTLRIEFKVAVELQRPVKILCMGLRLQNPRSDHQPLDLARPFVDFRDARVAIRPLDGIFAAVAVAAVDLNGFVRDSGRPREVGKAEEDNEEKEKATT
jgi:hypothetical protein